MRVILSQEMQEIEAKTYKDFNFSESFITENVGLLGASFIEEKFLSNAAPDEYGEVVILAGRGNNGANGLAIARHLANHDFSVRVFMLFPENEWHEEVIRQVKLAKNYGVKLNELSSAEELSSYFGEVASGALVVDAILGLGLRLPLSNDIFEIINLANDAAQILISIDVPTGLCGNTGAISGNAIMADVTLTTALPKRGFYVGEGPQHIGEVITLDGGIPKNLLEGGDTFLLGPESVTTRYTGRDKWAHKNTFGHTLVVGGSPGLTGALIMASEAALKVGTGLVTASTWKESYPELCSRVIPEVITGLIPTKEGDVEKIIKKLERWDCIVVGPGLGRSEKGRSVLLEILNHFAGPVVVDADAIRVLSLKEDIEVISKRKWPTVFTPHIGEFADFIGVEKENVLNRPLDYLKEVVDQANCCFVLKGSCSYLGFPDGQFYINHYPNDGMASGGSGDVLAGILGGLLAQYPMEKKSSAIFADKSIIFDSIRFGVIAHTLAGKYAAENLGARSMTARSIIEHLSDAFSEIESDGERIDE